MAINGVHHIGLATNDYEGTLEFYTNVVGWPVAWQDQNFGPDGKEVVRHLFLDAGNGTYLAFMCSVPDSPMFPEKWDPDIDNSMGMKAAIYHFAFSVESEDDLDELQDTWRSRGLEVSGVMDHGWCKSIYFRDPINHILIEASVQTRAFGEDDKLLKPRAQGGFQGSDDAELELTAKIIRSPVEAVKRMGEANWLAGLASPE